MKALIVNRIGDFGLSLGIFAIFFVFGSIDYSTVFSTVTYLAGGSKLIFFQMEFDILSLICFFLFVGAVGKSAQIGLHTWLPDAMEGFYGLSLNFTICENTPKFLGPLNNAQVTTPVTQLLGKIQDISFCVSHKETPKG